MKKIICLAMLLLTSSVFASETLLTCKVTDVGDVFNMESPLGKTLTIVKSENTLTLKLNDEVLSSAVLEDGAFIETTCSKSLAYEINVGSPDSVTDPENFIMSVVDVKECGTGLVKPHIDYNKTIKGESSGFGAKLVCENL